MPVTRNRLVIDSAILLFLGFFCNRCIVMILSWQPPGNRAMLENGCCVRTLCVYFCLWVC